MKRSIAVAYLPFLFLSAQLIWGDMLRLRDGKAIQGTFLGGNARQIDFLNQAGQSQSFPITSVISVSFSAPTAAVVPNASAEPVPAARQAVMIPAGTQLRVRTIDAIDVDVAQAGTKFRASLDDPVTVGGSVVIPRGADVILQAVKVQQSGKMKGSDLIQLKMESIAVQGVPHAVVSSVAESKGKSEGKATARKTLGGAGLGAVIGGIAGGGKGAAIGAAAGGTGGAIISA